MHTSKQESIFFIGYTEEGAGVSCNLMALVGNPLVRDECGAGSVNLNLITRSR